MDDIDLANDHAEMHRQHALKARPIPQPIPKGNGRCWLCEIDVEGDRRFCCRECADAWEEGQSDETA